METTQATIHARMNHRNCGFKVKRRLKLAHRRGSGEDPCNVNVDARGWKVKRRLKLAYPHRHIPRVYAFSTEARGQSTPPPPAPPPPPPPPPPPLMLLMKFEVPSLLVVVTLKYQAKTKSIFQENLATFWCFFAATTVYWLIAGALKQITTIDEKRALHTLLSNAALASGVLSLISLVAMFFPYPVSLLPVAVVMFSPVALALLHAFTLFLRGIECVVNKIHGVFVWARGGCNLTEEASSAA